MTVSGWHRKECAKFAARVAGYTRMQWAVTTPEDCGDDSVQYHAGSGTTLRAALNSLAKDLRWWRAHNRKMESEGRSEAGGRA